MNYFHLLFARYPQAIRFIISGTLATCTNLVALYVLTENLHIHYLQSSACAFVISFLVSFTLQKFWTFSNSSLEMVHKQLVGAFAVALFNLLINMFLMYGFVEYVGLHYLLAQIVTSALIAGETFVLFRYVVFAIRP